MKSKISAMFLMALTITIVHAQTTTSTLTGVVTDGTGAAVPQASVRAINEGSGVALPAVTNESGLYRFVSLIPGSYRIEVEAQGFEKLVRRGVTVQISETLQVDLTLKLGNVQETVTVTGAATVLATES